MNLPPELAHKWSVLLESLSDMDGAVVAYSGGVDSTLLLVAAARVLGDRCLAVMGISPSYPPSQQEEALAVARGLGVIPRLVDTVEMSDPDYLANPEDRCFHCKKHLFAALADIARAQGLQCVLDGSNADDVHDYRPGFRAGALANVVSPLLEAGLTKSDIRALLKELGLLVWDKPAQPCLASRIPYGHKITEEKLARIDAAERAVRLLGFPVVRVRDWGHLAVVEVAPEKLEMLFSTEGRSAVTAALLAAGYKRVALDTAGYRTGSLNEALKNL